MSFINRILGVGLALVSTGAMAGETVLSCVTELPTTSYLISDEGDHYNLHIYHHNGVDFMPVHKGMVVPKEIPNLAKRAQTLMTMGVRPVVRFEKKECEQNGILWRCFTNKPKRLGELDTESVYFAMGKLDSNYDGFKWSSIETFLILNVEGESMSVSLSFQEKDCRGKQ